MPKDVCLFFGLKKDPSGVSYLYNIGFVWKCQVGLTFKSFSDLIPITIGFLASVILTKLKRGGRQMSGSGTSRNSNSKDRRTVTFTLGEGEVPLYNNILKELGTSLSNLMRLAIKLLLLVYEHYMQGGQVILRDKDGLEKPIFILEFQGARAVHAQKNVEGEEG